MEEQDFWDGTKYTLHNFDISDEEHVQAAPFIPIFESLDDIQPEEITVPIKETPLPIEPKKPRPPKPRNTVKVMCLPASFHDTIDPVYGDTNTVVTYDNQFPVDIEVLETTDLSCRFRTNLTSIERQSIIFFPKERRWWKVMTIERSKEGLILNCMPSDVQPSFT